MQNDEIITHDVNAETIGNNAFELHPSALCCSPMCLQLQRGDGGVLIDTPQLIETFVPLMNPLWSAGSVRQRKSEARRVFQRVMLGLGAQSADCTNLTWMLLFDAVKAALDELTAALAPNTAQQFYCTMAYLYINHWKYATDEAVRAMYEYCRSKRKALLDIDTQARIQKVKNAKEGGALTPKLAHAFAALGGKQADGTPNLDYVYSTQTTRMGKITHKLLLVCRRNECRLLRVYFKVNGALRDAVTSEVVALPCSNHITVEQVPLSSDTVSAAASFTEFKTSKDKKTRERREEVVPLPDDLAQLLLEEMQSRQHRLSFFENVSSLLFVDTKGKALDGPSQSDKFTGVVNRHFKCISRPLKEAARESDHKIGTTEIRKYFASLDAEKVWEAQEIINEAVAPFSHSGKADLGVHKEYMFVVPMAE